MLKSIATHRVHLTDAILALDVGFKVSTQHESERSRNLMQQRTERKQEKAAEQ